MSLRRPKRNKWEHRALAKLRQQQAAKALHNNHPKTMSYYHSVLEATDNDGLLTVRDAMKLMKDHNTSLYEMESEGYKGSICHAESLLNWLGY